MTRAAWNAVYGVRGLRPLQRLVLVAIARWFRVEHRTAYRSLDLLAADLEMPRSTVGRLVQQLVALKVLQLAAAPTGRTAARYRIPVVAAALEACSVPVGETLRPEVARGPAVPAVASHLPAVVSHPGGTDVEVRKDRKKEEDRRAAPAVEHPPDPTPVLVPTPVLEASVAASSPGRRAADGPGPVLVLPTGPAAMLKPTRPVVATRARRRTATQYRHRPDPTTWDRIADVMAAQHFADSRERMRFADATLVAESAQQLVVVTPWARRLVTLYGVDVLQAAAAAVRPGLTLVLQEAGAADLWGGQGTGAPVSARRTA